MQNPDIFKMLVEPQTGENFLFQKHNGNMTFLFVSCINIRLLNKSLFACSEMTDVHNTHCQHQPPSSDSVAGTVDAFKMFL